MVTMKMLPGRRSRDRSGSEMRFEVVVDQGEGVDMMGIVDGRFDMCGSDGDGSDAGW